jgi:hypothetical protein
LIGLSAAVATVAIGILLALAIYDFKAFQPHRARIDALISSAHPAERQPPAALKELLLVEFESDTSWSATRILLSKLDLPAARSSGCWHFKSFLWWRLVRLHLSEDDQITLIVSQSYLGRRSIGFAAGARVWFDRPLEALDEAELATLVVLMRWPSRFSESSNAGLLNAARDRWLERKRAAFAARQASPSP